MYYINNMVEKFLRFLVNVINMEQDHEHQLVFRNKTVGCRGIREGTTFNQLPISEPTDCLCICNVIEKLSRREKWYKYYSSKSPE